MFVPNFNGVHYADRLLSGRLKRIKEDHVNMYKKLACGKDDVENPMKFIIFITSLSFKMRWSYCLLSGILFLVFLFQSDVKSAPFTVKGLKPIEQTLSKRLELQRPESQITLVKRGGKKTSGGGGVIRGTISKLFGKSKPATPVHIPKPGYFDPPSAHVPPPLRKGTMLKPGYTLPEHMTQRPKEKEVVFDPVKLGLKKGPSSSKRK